MNRTRWNYLKSLKPAAPRYMHESCTARMVPDPRSALVGYELPWLPQIVRTGGTFNDGRNAAKRQKRALAKQARASLVGARGGRLVNVARWA
jgi:hypothetical protein